MAVFAVQIVNKTMRPVVKELYIVHYFGGSFFIKVTAQSRVQWSIRRDDLSDSTIHRIRHVKYSLHDCIALNYLIHSLFHVENIDSVPFVPKIPRIIKLSVADGHTNFPILAKALMGATTTVDSLTQQPLVGKDHFTSSATLATKRNPY